MALAQAYRDAKRWDAEETMQMCAFRQGHGTAAYKLGMHAEALRQHMEAFKFYQDGVRFGSEDCANALWILFDEDDWKKQRVEVQRARRQLDLAPDSERTSRYLEIAKALGINPDLRLTQIDKVLPMPPAPLPAWRGIQDALEAGSDLPPAY
ncbi:DUF6396 domain-containing protein [Massilia sp. TS11]|uniref:DUF6396 domain-containing protein n=1 Tax=Massilia sp. TS11 TaxID=2908003 RepID=UPI001EDB9F60|nr:DUF6396 domain-containing protein [Massilia sp. TS11]MCG2586834.1 DUF6396 domain-containing protein [Massilia sp. TS11]